MKKNKIFFVLIVSTVLLSACQSANSKPIRTESVTDPVLQTTDQTEETGMENEPASPVISENNAYPMDTNVKVGIVMDLSLADAIRYELGYDKEHILTYADLENVTSLWVFEEKINSLKGISLLVNLSDLRISSGNIEDISELGELSNLNSIDISNSYIREIPDLSGNAGLETIYFCGNLIEDVSSLSRLENLKYVTLTDNRINSIEQLGNLSQIESLAIDNNCILDYEKISDNSRLINAINEGSQCTYEQCLEVEQRAKAIVDTFPNDISELELEKIIYQYVIDNMEYEIEDRPMAAFSYHAITKGIGVCGDYAELFCILARHAGLEAYVCGSDTHAWNIVKIDDRYYHCDALWDEPEEEWVYFNQSTEYILTISDHWHDVNRYPKNKE